MQIAFASAARLPRARALVLACLVTGIVGEALFRDARLGLNFSIFVLLAASVHAAFAAVHGCTRRRIFAAVLPAVASVPVFVFDSQWARFFAIPSTLGWLVLVPRFVEHGLDLRVFGRVPERAAEAVVRLAPAFARAVRLPLESVHGSAGNDGKIGALRTALVGLALGIPSALVFIALFSFDAKFSRALVAVGRRSDDAFAFALSALGLALLVVLLVAIEDVRAPSKASSAEAHQGVEPYRVPPRLHPARPDAAKTARFVVPGAAWTLVLLQVSAVFGLYVALHATELFAGHAHVRTTPGVTYAGQLHAGFFALLMATALAVGLVLLGHALTARSPEPLTSKQHRSLLASELILLTLSGPTLVSCAQKLVLYIDAYGQTYLRLGVAITIVVAFPLVVLTAIKSLRRAWTGYGSSVALLGLAIGTGSAFVDADAHVARVNLERAMRGARFDVKYIGTLGSGALRGLAASRPADPNAEARWLDLVGRLAGNWQSSAVPLRAFRRQATCSATLPRAVCVSE